MSCSVRSDIFTDPKHLSCLHSFCVKCLERWYETRGGGEAIKCPKCQTLCRVPASGDLKDFPTSFYLNGFIDVLAIKECKNTHVTCANCNKKSAEATYCFQCCIFYCEECLIGHNIMRDKKVPRKGLRGCIEETGLLFKTRTSQRRAKNTTAKNAKRPFAKSASFWITEVMF